VTVSGRASGRSAGGGGRSGSVADEDILRS
jgi:hypothetical protein